MSTSQASQDRFVFDMLGEHGTYIEIGAHKPVKNSNTAIIPYLISCLLVQRHRYEL